MFEPIAKKSTSRSKRTRPPKHWPASMPTRTFPFQLWRALRELGHDVLTSLDAGRANLKVPDEEVLEYAESQGRHVLTLNRKHFVRLHQTKPAHSGIIVCTVDPDFKGQANRIHSCARRNDLPQRRTRPSEQSEPWDLIPSRASATIAGMLKMISAITQCLRISDAFSRAQVSLICSSPSGVV